MANSSLRYLPTNSWGNVDIRSGVPRGVVFLPDEVTAARCRLSGIPVAPALVGFEACGRKGMRSRPVFASLPVSVAGWQENLALREKSEEGKEKLRQLADDRRQKAAVAQLEADAVRRRRSEAGHRSAKTARRNRELKRTPYGRLLLALCLAIEAEKHAEGRTASRKDLIEYLEHDPAGYGAANYRRSHVARLNDYFLKERQIKQALVEAPLAGVTAGSSGPCAGCFGHVICFDLPTGQVAFDCSPDVLAPAYTGTWAGFLDLSRWRVAEAVTELLAKTNGIQAEAPEGSST
jgi:hypothetical protein